MDKTLVILTPGFAANENDSTCLPPVQQFTMHLKERNPALQIIVLAIAYPFTTKSYTWYGCTVIPLRGNRYRKILRPLLWQKIRNKLNSTRRSSNIIGLLSFWCGEWAMLGTEFGEKYSIPHYCWLQGQDSRPGNKYARYFQHKQYELIALSDSLAAEFFKNYQTAPAQVIPFGTLPVKLNNRERHIDIIGVGSLIPLKQYPIFIQVIHQLKKVLPGIKAVLCGKGTQMNELKQMVKLLKLEDNIQFTGEKQHAEVFELMQQSRILLHPSSYEGFSTVCAEALQCGCHVISFCRAMDAAIEQWHIVKDEAAMYQQVLSILQNPGTVYQSIVPYTMDESVGAITTLFNYSENSTL
jgi:glycosyltransferase involved in cell wall biosynthesis